jgi:hypothetical protein
MLEQADLELRPQDPGDRRVDLRDRNQAALERIEIRPLLAVRRLKDDVEPGIEGVLSSRRRTLLRHVQHSGAARAGRVGNDEAPKPQSRLSTSVSKCRFCVAGDPSTEL